MIKGALSAAALVVGLSFTPVAASAAPILGGATAVDLTATSTFESLGYSLATYGTASAFKLGNDIVATFLVTGGTRNDSTGALLVNHNGSGLNFTSGSNTLSIGNFVVDTANGVVRGSAAANGFTLGTLSLFNLGANSTLTLTNEAAAAFTTTLGAPNLAGADIGTAQVNVVFGPSGVPEPATWGLMIAGVGFVGASLRRRLRATTDAAAA
ncbi:PEPxxWA-CTERM sorting domain-containing protein [uncultured Sphingomonas sp.]|uniref:PEPxxWA-CTERM sorting domain-containing protein n=1 Tax=uncultured Sphingomonas sp. TaxID=158754 RepID=UPI0025EC0462|nr:PEPxxWA-CTERM sorting domain-containing protein [uncultured Sphingomonas sp.]